MRKWLAAAGSTVFFVLAPGFVAGLVPWRISERFADSSSLGWPIQTLGVLLMAAGALVLLDSFVRFVMHFGTPAQIFPTENLVVTGLYRYVRNPMYVAVITVIIGQSLLLGSASVLGYGALVTLSFTSSCWRMKNQRCGQPTASKYEEFCSNVPQMASAGDGLAASGVAGGGATT